MTEEISYPVINKEICKGCMRCIVGCPQNAILLSEDMNNEDINLHIIVEVAVQDVKTVTLPVLSH